VFFVLGSVSVVTSVLTASDSLRCVAILGVVTTRFTRHPVLQASIAIDPIADQ
jgi:hypothetical protein